MAMIMQPLVTMIITTFLLFSLCISTNSHSTINNDINHHNNFSNNDINYQQKQNDTKHKQHWFTMNSPNDVDKISSQQNAMKDMGSDGDELMPMLQAGNSTKMTAGLKRDNEYNGQVSNEHHVKERTPPRATMTTATEKVNGQSPTRPGEPSSGGQSVTTTKSSSGLDGGAIAAIVLGTVLLIVIIAAIIIITIFCIKKAKEKRELEAKEKEEQKAKERKKREEQKKRWMEMSMADRIRMLEGRDEQEDSSIVDSIVLVHARNDSSPPYDLDISASSN